MKIRIFALAKELGLDSKDLIEIGSRAGIQIKNSALASITPEERDTIVAFMKNDGGGSTTAPTDAPMVPTRDPARDTGGKVRKITAPAASKAAAEEVQESEEAVEEVVASVAAEAPVEVEQVEEPVAETPDVAEEPAAESEVPEPETAETEEQDAEDEVVEPAAAAEDDSEPGDGDEDTPAVNAVKRDDYVSGTGAGNERGWTRNIREMRPIGSVQDPEARRPRPREKKEPDKKKLPALAALPDLPAVKPKAPKTKDAPAQKPVIPLTKELYEQKQGPLGDRLRTKEDRDRREQSTGGGNKRRGASLLEQRKRERESEKDQETPGRRGRRSSSPMRRRRKGPVELKSAATIQTPITVRSLSEAIGRPAKQILGLLFKSGRMVTINEGLEEEEALTLSMELGVDLEIKTETDMEEVLADRLETETDSDSLADRPPIVTILGHVDHGKTSLLDKIRASNVVSGEAGGITQHIASYQVQHNGKPVTFVDTPGHAAFGEMRSRGANVTDIIVLVVAADDGIMPQTEECISHAKAAGVPVIVAMNKVDLPDRDEQRVLQGLTNHELLPAEWGGEIEVVRTSAMTGQGIDDLLETILLTAELHEYKAEVEKPAVGVCLEAFRDEGRGAIAWLIVQAGTLRVGDIVLCGSAYGRVRAMYNDRNEAVQEALPSSPVKLAGLDAVPGAGDHFFVMGDVEQAREVAEDRHHRGRAEVLARRGSPKGLDDILAAAREGAVQDLPLIVKADTPGSLEALRGEISKFEHPEVRVQFIHEAVGGVNESDIYLASASGAIIIAFHVIAEDRAEMLADQEGVEIRRYNIIYEVTDSIRNALEGLLRPEIKEVATGRALVLRTFHISRFGTIAGCRVLSGTIERSHRCHVIRDQKLIRDYNLASLKREKDDVKEVREGMECGIRLEGFNDIKEGDLLEAFRVEEVQRKLDD